MYDFLKSNVDPPRSIFLVFQLPDELILSILSHISPDPRLVDRYARFSTLCLTEIRDWRYKRGRFLRPLSMTCRAMRLRLLPWVWEHLVMCGPFTWGIGQEIDAKLNITVSAFRADALLATSVRYFCILLPPWVRADPRPLMKIHEDGSAAVWAHLSSVCQMLGVPSKSSHIRDRAGGRHNDPTQECVEAC